MKISKSTLPLTLPFLLGLLSASMFSLSSTFRKTLSEAEITEPTVEVGKKHFVSDGVIQQSLTFRPQVYFKSREYKGWRDSARLELRIEWFPNQAQIQKHGLFNLPIKDQLVWYALLFIGHPSSPVIVAQEENKTPRELLESIPCFSNFNLSQLEDNIYDLDKTFRNQRPSVRWY